MELKGECVVVNVAGRYMTKWLNTVFRENLQTSVQTLDSLFTRTRSDGQKLHLMFHGDDAVTRGFRYMAYESMDMIYAGCAMSIDAIESGATLNEETFDAKIARIKMCASYDKKL